MKRLSELLPFFAVSSSLDPDTEAPVFATSCDHGATLALAGTCGYLGLLLGDVPLRLPFTGFCVRLPSRRDLFLALL